MRCKSVLARLVDLVTLRHQPSCSFCVVGDQWTDHLVDTVIGRSEAGSTQQAYTHRSKDGQTRTLAELLRPHAWTPLPTSGLSPHQSETQGLQWQPETALAMLNARHRAPLRRNWAIDSHSSTGYPCYSDITTFVGLPSKIHPSSPTVQSRFPRPPKPVRMPLWTNGAMLPALAGVKSACSSLSVA